MSGDSFLSASWYRVAQLRPKLREHGELHRHQYRGEVSYVLYDHARGQAHRLSAASYRLIAGMDGKRTIDQLWTEIAAHMGEHAPSQDQMVQFLTELHSADLLQSDVAPDASEILERANKLETSQLRRQFLNPLSIKVPIWDPDRFLTRTLPYVRWLFGWGGAVLWLIVVASASVLAAQNWNELGESAPDRILAAQNLLLIGLSYPIIKALHEFGHAYATKAYGGAVHEVGIMFLVLFPMPYVDASASTRFHSKRRRIVVGAAGMLVEIFIAAVAFYVWLAVEPGIVRALAFNTILIAGVSTILFNGNPLLRYDGYFILADFLEIPDLAQRANRYWGYLVEHYVFATDRTEDVRATRGERLWFLFYAPAAFVYRQVVMLTIAIYVAQEYLAAGILLAVWSVVSGLVFPIAKALWKVVTGPRFRRNRYRAVGLTSAAIAVAGIVLFLVPAPLRTNTEGVVWLPDDAIVRAGTDGFVQQLLIVPGTTVLTGTALAQTEEPVLQARLEVLRSRMDELIARYASEQFTDRAQAAITATELEQARAELRTDVEREVRLVVRSRADGVFHVTKENDLPGRFFREGQPIGYVLPPSSRLIRATVGQDDVDLVRNRAHGASVKLSESLGQTWNARVVREVPAGRDELPSKALGVSGGGAVAINSRDNNGTRALQRVFQFDLELAAETMMPAAFGGRVHVRFDHFWEPLGWQLWRRLRQLLLSRLRF